MSITTRYGLTLTVEISLSSATSTYGIWNTSLWDTGLWGPDETWVDVSAYMRSIGTDRHFSRDMTIWEAGTANLVLNNRDGRFSSKNLSGPYVTSGVTQIRPWRPMRVRATYAGITYYVYRGYVRTFRDSYVSAGPNKGDAITTCACVDEFANLARVDGSAQVAAGADEGTGARFHRILNAAGHLGTRNIDVGVSTVQATTLASNVSNELKLTLDSEGMASALYVDDDGTVTFKDAYSLIEDLRSNTVQITWGDAGGTEIPYADLSVEDNGDLLVNYIEYTRVGGTVQRSSDVQSQALYSGIKRDTRTDLICSTDAQVANIAAFRLQERSHPEERIESIKVFPVRPSSTNTAIVMPLVLGTKVRDLWRVKRQPPGSYTISELAHVAGIKHTITAENMETSFDLWSADIYQGVGRWDISTWASSTDTAPTWFF